MAYSLAFAEESTIPNLTQPPNKRMQEQLRISGIQSFGVQRDEHHYKYNKADAIWPEPTKIDNEPLPRTITDALRLNNRRAIVITETAKPFKVVQVNKAWEGLCEYSYVESKGKSLGSLLKGPETDPLAVTALMSQLLRGEEAGIVLTNYTKSGRAFQNRLRVGPLLDETTGRLAYYVGVLQEI
jgi:PAS domain-containing protein